jgi:hypothetical protein
MITRLKSQGIELDLTEGVPVPLNFSISDIREPNTRKRNFSKEIVLPGTAKNMLFFKGSFNFTQSGVDAFFDPTTQVECELTKDEFLVMKGLIQLKSVTILNNYVSFQVLIYSDAVDLFLALQNTKVAELDWSDYDHTLNQTNIIASWTTAAGSGYYYPLIQKGTNPSALIYRTIDLYPYIYLREAFIKCFELAGVSISGAFINSTRFSQVLFGYGGGELTSVPESVALQRRVKLEAMEFVGTYQGQNGFLNYNTSFVMPFGTSTSGGFPAQGIVDNATITDAIGQYVGGVFYAQFTGQYVLDLDFENARFNLPTGSILETSNPLLVRARISKNNQLLGYIQGGFVYNPANDYFDMDFTNSGLLTMDLLSGDTVEIILEVGVNFISVTSPTLEINDATIDGYIQFSFTSVNISDGDTVFINRFIPEMTCADLVMNTFRQFNLYMTDIDSGTVEISPFPSFYSNTNQFDDWSELLDIGKEIIVKPAANEYGKNVKFMFAEIQESDAINHFNKWGKRYGDLTHNQGSYYAKADKQIKLAWGTIVPYDIGTTQVVTVPRFMIIDPFTGNTKPCKSIPRIMNRLGLITGVWSLQSADGGGEQTFATYPAVHHFNSRTNPTFDLNFMLVDEVYYPTTVVTTVNSFSEYYFDMINEIVSPEGKLISAYFRLDNELIESFNLKRLVMVNGALFRVNKIIDFDSDIQATTKVELIKVLRPKTRNRVQLTLPIATLPGDVIAPNPFDPTTDDIISSPPNSVITKNIIR